jgi:hypothetical protein
MEETMQLVIGWAWPLAAIILIVLAATRKGLKGKPWLIAHLGGTLAIMLMWRTPELLSKLGIINADSLSTFYDWFLFPLNIIGFVAFCLLIPYVLTAPSGQEGASRDILEQTETASSNVDPKLVGIEGWLVLPAIGLILGPIVAVVSLVIALGLFEDVSDAGYGGLYLFNILVSVGLLTLLIYAATRFFGKRANAPSVMITLLMVQVVAAVVCLVLALMAEAESFAVEDGKALIRGLIGAAIWIPYFRVSKRVKATFVK